MQQRLIKVLNHVYMSSHSARSIEDVQREIDLLPATGNPDYLEPADFILPNLVMFDWNYVDQSVKLFKYVALNSRSSLHHDLSGCYAIACKLPGFDSQNFMEHCHPSKCAEVRVSRKGKEFYSQP